MLQVLALQPLKCITHHLVAVFFMYGIYPKRAPNGRSVLETKVHPGKRDGEPGVRRVRGRRGSQLLQCGNKRVFCASAALCRGDSQQQ